MLLQLADIVLNRFVDRLLADVRRKAGLRCDEIVARKLARVLSLMPRGELEHWVTTVETVDADHPEWLNLIEALTVHETYFFRDADHHAHLHRRILPALIAARRQCRQLVLWSAGCATGEEAYSLAILVLEALVDQGEAIKTATGIETPWRIEVVGTDISRPALRRARNAIYDTGPMGAFRDLPQRYRCWFCPSGQAEGTALFRVRDDARRIVRFARCNLVLDDLPLPRADLISCRNVLIYFDDDARSKVQHRLISGLADDGWLLLGSTDRLIETARFERWPGHRAMAYRQHQPAEGILPPITT